MIRRLCIPLVIALILPASAFASCSFRIASVGGTSTVSRDMGRGCTGAETQYGLQVSCLGSDDALLTYQVPLTCKPGGTPAVYVSFRGDSAAADVSAQRLGRTAWVRVRVSGGSVTIRKASVGYYC